MNKKIFILASVIVVGVSCFYTKLPVAVVNLATKKEVPPVTLNSEDNFKQKTENEISDKQLQQKLLALEADLKKSQLKNYSDFTVSELEKYNQQVRESVQIKKALFLKKYARWSDI